VNTRLAVEISGVAEEPSPADMVSAITHLTSGRLLARNTLWNLAGQILPMVVGIITIPVIIRVMGVDRFGVLSLAWVVVGYFSLFDLGIGRALTKLVAEKLGTHEERAIGPLARTSLLMMFTVGIVGTTVTLVISPFLVYRLLKIPPALQHETLLGFYFLAVSIPIVTLTAGFRGILEALQQFRAINLVRVPTSILSFAAPLLVFPFSHGLVPVIAVLVIGRLIGCGSYAYTCLVNETVLQAERWFDRSSVAPLFRFGGWMTVVNLVGPLMFYLDRFLVGALLAVSAVAYYTTPVDAVLRLAVIPNAVVGVLFPAFSVSLNQNPDRTGLLLSRAFKYIFLSIFPIALVIVAFAPEGLRLWLGPTFSDQGTAVLRLTSAGLFVNSLAILPFVLIQSAGRPDITAWMLLAELPVYGITVWELTRRMGVTGTATAWTGRICVEAIILLLISRRIVPQATHSVLKLLVVVGGGLAVLYAASLPTSVEARIGFVGFGLLTFAVGAWFRALSPSEREFVGAWVEGSRRNSS